MRLTCSVFFFASCFTTAERQAPGTTSSRGISWVGAKWTWLLGTSTYFLSSSRASTTGRWTSLFEHSRDHAPVVLAIRGAHELLDLLLIGRPRCFIFLDQIAQRLLWDHWKHDRTHDPIRLINDGFGESKEQVGFAGHLFDIADKCLLHPPLGFGTQVMGHVDE